MPRYRLESIVQRIASEIHPDQYHALEQPVSNPSRQRSLSLQSTCENQPSARIDPSPLTPFLTFESDQLWSQTLQSLGPSVVVHDTAIPSHLQSVIAFRDNCLVNSRAVAALSEDADTLLALVAALVQKHATIARHTAAFDQEAATLQLTELTYSMKLQAVDERLRHFDALDSATRLLRRSGTSLVSTRPEQLRDEILDPLEAAILFVDSHPLLRDAGVHRSRFHHVLARALALIRDHLLEELRGLANRVNKMLSPPKPMPVDVVMYTEYSNYLHTDNGSFLNWTQDLTRRAQSFPDLQSILDDVRSAYFNARVQVIRPNLVQSLSDSAANRNDDDQSPMQRLASDVAFFVRALGREHALYKAFFGSHGYSAWLAYAQKILEPLYDSLRPLTLRITSVSYLCQMALLMEKYSDDDQLVDGNEFDSLYEVDRVDMDLEQDMNSLKILPLLRPLTDDIQSRLIFRTQAYVDNRLAKYVPTTQDLNLSQRRTSLRVEKSVTKQDALDIEFPENLFPQVYLPLAKALTLLQNIHDLVNQQVFGDLAHYIVRVCVQFLGGPFKSLASVHMGPADALLYHLGLLILLKTQVSSYDIHYSRNDYSIDFTLGLSAAWQKMRQGGFRLSTTELLQLARALAPKIVSTMIDANLEIDQELNRAVSVFVANACAPTCACLDEPDVQAATTAFKDNVLVHVPQILSLIRSYIDDDLVIEYLMEGVALTIMVSYEEFFQRVLLMTADGSRSALGDIMEADALEAFVSDIVANSLRQDHRNDPEENIFGITNDAYHDLQAHDSLFSGNTFSGDSSREPQVEALPLSSGLGLYVIDESYNVSPKADLSIGTLHDFAELSSDTDLQLADQSQSLLPDPEMKFEPPQEISQTPEVGSAESSSKSTQGQN